MVLPEIAVESPLQHGMGDFIALDFEGLKGPETPKP